jgi:hypothetical protein
MVIPISESGNTTWLKRRVGFKFGGQQDLISRVSLSSVHPSLQEGMMASMLKVEPIKVSFKVRIPISSPIHKLQNLQTGWDGYGAEPLSQEVLLKAQRLWEKILEITQDTNDIPAVRPSANGSVAFTWTTRYPTKELEIALIDRSGYYAESLLSFKGKDTEGNATSLSELVNIIRSYLEL